MLTGERVEWQRPFHELRLDQARAGNALLVRGMCHFRAASTIGPMRRLVVIVRVAATISSGCSGDRAPKPPAVAAAPSDRG